MFLNTENGVYNPNKPKDNGMQGDYLLFSVPFILVPIRVLVCSTRALWNWSPSKEEKTLLIQE